MLLWVGMALGAIAILSISTGHFLVGLVFLVAAMVIWIITSDEDEYWNDTNRRL